MARLHMDVPKMQVKNMSARTPNTNAAMKSNYACINKITMNMDNRVTASLIALQ